MKVHQRMEPVVMMAHEQVHQLVDDDVLEALRRFLRQLEIQPDLACGRLADERAFPHGRAAGRRHLGGASCVCECAALGCGDGVTEEISRCPDDPVAFIRSHLAESKVLWTYHASMRLARRTLTRADVFAAAAGFELVEAYPDDKYFPSYLVLGVVEAGPIHVLVATDVEGDNIRIMTAYRPDPAEWEADMRTRRKKKS